MLQNSFTKQAQQNHITTCMPNFKKRKGKQSTLQRIKTIEKVKACPTCIIHNVIFLRCFSLFSKVNVIFLYFQAKHSQMGIKRE